MFDKLRDNSRIIVYIVVAAFVISGGFMGYGAYMSGGNNSAQQGTNPNEAIAEVNGEEISYQEYLNVMRNNAQRASQLSSTQLLNFRLNVLNSIIERKIILAQADEMGISAQVTKEDIDNSIQDILKNNNMTEEELRKNLEEQDYSMSDLRNDLRLNLQTQKTIQKTVEKSYEDVKVSEEELKEEYDKQAKNNEDIASFKNKKDEIKQSLLEKKQNNEFKNWMEDLKESADIKIYDNSLKGVKALNNENFEVAINSFNKALDNSDTPTNYIYLAQAYEKDQKSDKSIETYETAIEKYPENWEIRYNYGQLMINLKNNEKAKKQLEKASEFATDSDFMAHYQIYQSFNNIGAEDKAQEEMDKIIEIQQNMNQNSQNPNTETEQENETRENFGEENNTEKSLDEEDLEVDTVPSD
ncbi:MAG TPA: SurA N-terminal domain-containing protein [Halanaerobiales bacterium]|nr:SurA N-terminal domain-containing protein [Halanaerobiales bacterium]